MEATVVSDDVLPNLSMSPFSSNLCFNKDEFMKDDFNVDSFVIECKRRVPLEKLRDDLTLYLKMLQSSMIELINQDYADFVNLSSNLVGFDKAINNLNIPLGQLREEVYEVQRNVDDVLQQVEEKLSEQKEIRQRKAMIQRIMHIVQGVDKIEMLLGIQQTENQGTHSSSLGGHLIERVATEFNKLQFLVNKTKDIPLVDNLKPRIAVITTTLQYSLEQSFQEGLRQSDAAVLRQCLRTYSLIDKTSDAELMFRNHVVRPYMEEVISEEKLASDPQNLKGVYSKILDFIPKKCKILKTVTSGPASSDAVHGYDFLVNAVWPEVVTCIESRLSSIFAPGNPNVFHEKYCSSIDFLERFERQCSSVASVKRLRAHPSYNQFMAKWSLPVYYQIRFQEIAGAFEMSLLTAFNKTTGPELHLMASQSALTCVRRCWDREILLLPLSHRFWKLSLQILSRYATWIGEVYLKQVKQSAEERSTPSATTGTGSGDSQKAEVTSAKPAPITVGQMLMMVSDAHHVCAALPEIFTGVIEPHLLLLGVADMTIFKESLYESKDTILKQLPPFGEYVIETLTNQSSAHFKSVNDLPRLYRRTNREIPSKPSVYVGNVFKPLLTFLEEHKDVLRKEDKNAWTCASLGKLTEQYFVVTNDVLTSVKKMEESLKRLKNRKTASTASLVSMGMSDDDKIRLQLYLDVQEYGNKIREVGQDVTKFDDYKKLSDLVDAARGDSHSDSAS